MEPAIRRALGVTTLTVCAAVAGCATAGTTTARGSAPATAAASRTASAAPATSRQRAVGDGGLLKFPSSTVVSTALVDDASFWLAPGQPLAVLGWEQAHLPRRFTPEDQGFGPPSWDRMFSLPPWGIPVL